MTSLFSPDAKSSHIVMLSSPSTFFISPPAPAYAPCIMPIDLQSPFDASAQQQLQSPTQRLPLAPLRFHPEQTMHTGEVTAFNFHAGVQQQQPQQQFNVDIAPSSQSRSLPPAPLLSHHNPDLLDGFLLDGGSPMSPFNSIVMHSIAPTNRRKRKSASPSSVSAAGFECDAVELAPKKKKHGKSLIDSRHASSPLEPGASAGHTSPLLELLQQSNQSGLGGVAEAAAPSAVVVAPKSKKELRREKAALKLQRLEASIARLTEQVTATRAQELHASELARQMAAQAAHAAQLAHQHLAQRNSEIGMVESFFAEEAAASLPPLSPLSASNASGHASVSAPSSSTGGALRIALSSSSSSSSSASLSDGGDLSECSTPTMRERRLLATASPVESLDDAIDAALAAASAHGPAEAAPCRAQVEQLVALQWQEKARHLRNMQHALHSLEEDVQAHHTDSWISSADTALRFVSTGADADADDADRFGVRAALEQMRADQSLEHVSPIDLHHSIHEFTSVLIAKSRAQHCTFSDHA